LTIGLIGWLSLTCAFVLRAHINNAKIRIPKLFFFINLPFKN